MITVTVTVSRLESHKREITILNLNEIFTFTLHRSENIMKTEHKKITKSKACTKLQLTTEPHESIIRNNLTAKKANSNI